MECIRMDLGAAIVEAHSLQRDQPPRRLRVLVALLQFARIFANFHLVNGEA